MDLIRFRWQSSANETSLDKELKPLEKSIKPEAVKCNANNIASRIRETQLNPYREYISNSCTAQDSFLRPILGDDEVAQLLPSEIVSQGLYTDGSHLGSRERTSSIQLEDVTLQRWGKLK